MCSLVVHMVKTEMAVWYGISFEHHYHLQLIFFQVKTVEVELLVTANFYFYFFEHNLQAWIETGDVFKHNLHIDVNLILNLY